MIKKNVERMHLGQLVEALNKFGFTQTSSYFKGCANDSVTVDGWIEKAFVERHIGHGKLMRELECEVCTSIPLPEPEFKFTYETEEEYRNAELSGYIESFDCVRVTIKHSQGGEIDFPVKSREELNKVLDFHGSSIYDIYPTVHSYDVQDYL
jgi:hypothetical protein